MSSEPALPDLDRLWDYDRPAETESRFRALLAELASGGSVAFRAELLTQIARTEGLQGRIVEADATLDQAAPLLAAAGARARVRWLLERGRVRNSSDREVEAVSLFDEALGLAEASGEIALAIDAAHMLAIADAPERLMTWHRRALTMA
jgi:hypothetical protein